MHYSLFLISSWPSFPPMVFNSISAYYKTSAIYLRSPYILFSLVFPKSLPPPRPPAFVWGIWRLVVFSWYCFFFPFFFFREIRYFYELPITGSRWAYRSRATQDGWKMDANRNKLSSLPSLLFPLSSAPLSPFAERDPSRLSVSFLVATLQGKRKRSLQFPFWGKFNFYTPTHTPPDAIVPALSLSFNFRCCW